MTDPFKQMREQFELAYERIEEGMLTIEQWELFEDSLFVRTYVGQRGIKRLIQAIQNNPSIEEADKQKIVLSIQNNERFQNIEEERG